MIEAKIIFDQGKIATAIAEEVQKSMDSMECFDGLTDKQKQDVFETVHYEVSDFFRESNGMELD